MTTTNTTTTTQPKTLSPEMVDRMIAGATLTMEIGYAATGIQLALEDGDYYGEPISDGDRLAVLPVVLDALHNVARCAYSGSPHDIEHLTAVLNNLSAAEKALETGRSLA